MGLNTIDPRLFRLPLAIFYFAALIIVLLHPFNFSAPFPWVENTAKEWSDGVDFGTSGMLRSAAPPLTLYEGLIAGHGITIEVWLKTASLAQDGPARIVSYSLDPWRRNFTLGQERDALNIRLRTTETDQNGTNPDLEVGAVFLPGKLQHLVVTYDYRQQRVYVDGKQRASRTLLQGDFKDWSPFCFLAFGNEVTGARAWHGTIAFAAIYDKPLTENGVSARYQSGVPLREKLEDESPLLAFDFVPSLETPTSSAAKLPSAFSLLPLTRPVHVPSESRMIFSFFQGADGKVRLVGEAPIHDLMLNVILFVPIGVFLASLGGRKSRALALIKIVAVSIALSATFEGLQVFLVERVSSIFDVMTNAAGALCGSMVQFKWDLFRPNTQP